MIAEEDDDESKEESVHGDKDDIDDGEEVDRATVHQAKDYEDELKEFRIQHVEDDYSGSCAGICYCEF